MQNPKDRQELKKILKNSVSFTLDLKLYVGH
jgi:hypothetical protein